MKTKKQYTHPQVKTIVIDFNISLAMESLPPCGTGECNNNMPSSMGIDPYKNHQA
jgi:hypothetical protein